MTISMIVMREDGGSCSLMEGIRAMYPRTIVAIDPSLSERSLGWKKMAKLRRESRKSGMKIVIRAFPGYL